MRYLLPLCLAVALGLGLFCWRPAWVTVAAWALLLFTCLYLDSRQRRADDVEALEEGMGTSIAASREASEAAARKADDVRTVTDERHKALTIRLGELEQRIEAMQRAARRAPPL